MNNHPSYIYAKKCIDEVINAPKYVKKQCQIYLDICDGKDNKYTINNKKVHKIDLLLKKLLMPKGIKKGTTIYNSLSGYQFLLIYMSLTVVHKNNLNRRRYKKVILEIGRKNGKTFVIGVIFIILFFIEPSFSYFYSVAPDGSLSREVKKTIDSIIKFNHRLLPTAGKFKKFKSRRDDIYFYPKDTTYVPLNYSNSRLDGKEPNAYIVDETGALPNSYAIDAMESGQILVSNPLGFIVSTKYPTAINPMEDEVTYCKKVLDGLIEDETVLSLLYEPDNIKDWTTDDSILEHANPLALDIKNVWDSLIRQRNVAIEIESKRENFLTKHCNIIYQGLGTESFVSVDDVQACRVSPGTINWSGRNVYIGVDLAQTNDNCGVVMIAEDEGTILIEPMAFIPEGRIDEKNKYEHIDYREFIYALKCIACGDRTVDYHVIEQFVFDIEDKYDVSVVAIGYDRYNAMSSAQKWNEKYTTVEIRQHSDTLHPPTKLLYEKILNHEIVYEKNKLFEINFENARCTYDTNMNRYVNKRKSNGKVDLVVALINAVYLMQQDIIFADDWTVQT